MSLSLVMASAHAQVLRDGSIGHQSLGGGPNYLVTPGMGEQRGTNLFHSFQQFDIRSFESVTFDSPGFRNVLARVTGGTTSRIDGNITANTNLFLMNPSGIIFGSTATLNINGSFYATTADYLKLADGGRFSASLDPNDSILTTADPSAFGFSRPNPAAIEINGSKFLDPTMQTLAFVGGDVSVNGEANLLADDVQIHSVRSAGEATLQMPTTANGLRRAAISAEGFAQKGDVSFTGPVLDPELTVPSATVFAQRVVIRAGTLTVKNTSVAAFASTRGDGMQVKVDGKLALAERGGISASVAGDFSNSPAAEVTAGSVEIGFISQISTGTDGDGIGGDLQLSVREGLRLNDQAGIFTFANGSGASGNVNVTAGSVVLDRSSSILSFSGTTGKAGDLLLTSAGELSLFNGSQISTFTNRASGERIFASAENINISGESSILFLDASPDGFGGEIDLQARGAISIDHLGLISATTLGRDGADINVRAANLTISGEGTPNNRDTGIVAASNGIAGTHGGSIRLDIAQNLSVLNGGIVGTDTFGGGSGGDISISATNAIITGRDGTLSDPADNSRGITARNRTFSNTEMSGPSGNIHLTLSGKLEVADAGEIIVDSLGFGSGGNIDIGRRTSPSGISGRSRRERWARKMPATAATSRLTR